MCKMNSHAHTNLNFYLFDYTILVSLFWILILRTESRLENECFSLRKSPTEVCADIWKYDDVG